MSLPFCTARQCTVHVHGGTCIKLSYERAHGAARLDVPWLCGCVCGQRAYLAVALVLLHATSSLGHAGSGTGSGTGTGTGNGSGSSYNLTRCLNQLQATYDCAVAHPSSDGKFPTAACCGAAQYIIDACSDRGASPERLFGNWDAYTNNFAPNSTMWTDVVQNSIGSCVPHLLASTFFRWASTTDGVFLFCAAVRAGWWRMLPKGCRPQRACAAVCDMPLSRVSSV